MNRCSRIRCPFMNVKECNINNEKCPYFTKSTDFLWLMVFFANLFSDIGNITLTKNEMNNIIMMFNKEGKDGNKNC